MQWFNVFSNTVFDTQFLCYGKKCFNYNYDCGSTLTKCNGHVDEVMEFDENIKEISDKLSWLLEFNTW